jgi:hypothetical protein
MKRNRTGRRSLSILALLLGLGGCTKEDSLVLLDLRPSGPLGAPVVRIRLLAKGWPKRTVDGTLDVAGFRVGYYGPGDGSAVTVVAEGLDAADCVLGSGSATVPALKAGATSAPATLFVRPQPANGCVPDAGTDVGGDDAGSDGGGMDTAEDVRTDDGGAIGVDAAVETGGDGAEDVEADAGVLPDGGGPDGGVADGGAPDGGVADGGALDGDDDGRVADATVD